MKIPRRPQVLVVLLGFASCLSTAAQDASDTDFLAHALAAEKFIASHQIETEHGLLWRQSPESEDAPNHSFYHGSGGIALFYLELYETTSEDRFLEIARRAGNEIVASNAIAEANTISIYSGLSAHVFVLNELFKHTGDEKFRDAAKVALGRIKSTATEIGSGVAWVEQNPFGAYSHQNTNVGEVYDLTIGAAGVGETFLYAHRSGLDDESIQWATKIADRLLEVGESTDDGLRWPMMDNLPGFYIMPNFSHGPAGIAYFLADLHTETEEQKYLDAAVSAARYVQSRAVAKGDGVLVTHHESPEPANLFYLSSCHGPAGTGRLMFLLNRITGDDSWGEWIDENLRGLEATGAPEKRSDGLWNNLSQCCGDAGLGEYALYLYRATGKEAHRDLARRIARYIFSQANETDDTLSWTQAEMRIRPDWTQTQTGYMQGAAGIGNFFLHLATVDDEPAKIPLLATPFE